jgi:hypothetical protein
MQSRTHPVLLASSAQIHGTAWIGVGGAAFGALLVFYALEEAIRRLRTGVAVGVSLLVLIAGTAILPGQLPRLIGVGVGLSLVGVVAGVMLPGDRWGYLSGCAGGLLMVMFGLVVLFPQGDQWSGDLFALATVPVVVLAAWLPLAIGTALGSLIAVFLKGSRGAEVP